MRTSAAWVHALLQGCTFRCTCACFASWVYGLLHGLYVPGGAIAGYSAGALCWFRGFFGARVTQLHPFRQLDMVPAEYVSSVTVAAAAGLVLRYDTATGVPVPRNPNNPNNPDNKSPESGPQCDGTEHPKAEGPRVAVSGHALVWTYIMWTYNYSYCVQLRSVSASALPWCACHKPWRYDAKRTAPARQNNSVLSCLSCCLVWTSIKCRRTIILVAYNIAAYRRTALLVVQPHLSPQQYHGVRYPKS